MGLGDDFPEYEVLEREAQNGSQGIIHKCRNKSSEEIHAIKQLVKKSLVQNQNWEIRLENEINIMKMLANQDYIVKFIEMKETDQYVYIVMEWCDLTLRQLQGRLTISEKLKISLELANAIAVIHSKNIIHRDLKPENIMINVNPDGYRLKLIDFGGAKIAASENTTTYGTPAYAAPEFETQSSHDISVDIYSLGKIFQEIFFDGHTDQVLTFYGHRLLGQIYNYMNQNLLSEDPKIRHKIEDIQFYLRQQYEHIIRTQNEWIQKFIQSLNRKFETVELLQEGKYGKIMSALATPNERLLLKILSKNTGEPDQISRDWAKEIEYMALLSSSEYFIPIREYFSSVDYIIIAKDMFESINLIKILNDTKVTFQVIKQILLDLCFAIQALLAKKVFLRKLSEKNVRVVQFTENGSSRYRLQFISLGWDYIDTPLGEEFQTEQQYIEALLNLISRVCFQNQVLQCFRSQYIVEIIEKINKLDNKQQIILSNQEIENQYEEARKQEKFTNQNIQENQTMQEHYKFTVYGQESDTEEDNLVYLNNQGDELLQQDEQPQDQISLTQYMVTQPIGNIQQPQQISEEMKGLQTTQSCSCQNKQNQQHGKDQQPSLLGIYGHTSEINQANRISSLISHDPSQKESLTQRSISEKCQNKTQIDYQEKGLIETPQSCNTNNMCVLICFVLIVMIFGIVRK